MAPKTSAASSSAAKKSSSSSADVAPSKTKSPKAPTEFILRPHKTSSLKNASKVYVSPQLLQIQGWTAGSFVKVIKGMDEVVGVLHPWDAPDEEIYELNVILMSPVYYKHADFHLGDRLSLNKLGSSVPYADNINIEVVEMDQEKAINTLCDVGVIYNEFLVVDSELKVDTINKKSLEEDMESLSLTNSNYFQGLASMTPFLFHPKTTKVTIIKKETIARKDSMYSYSKVGGLDTQIRSIQNTISIPLYHPYIFTKFGISPPKGLLLHGPSGTGKSLILNTIASESDKTHIININGPSIVSKYLGGTEEKLRDYFKEASKYQPSIIFIDEIDSLVPSRNSDDSTEVDSRVVATLLTLMDGLSGSVVIIGATNRIGSIDSSLRRPGRFDQELEIGIPDAEARYDILVKQFESMKGSSSLTLEDIKQISQKTHGYVGADLVSLCRESIIKCITRGVANQGLKAISHELNVNSLNVELDDVEEAMKEIRPSAMREIVLEMPNVKWDDIGGQEILKRKLKEMVQLPLLAADTFKKLGVSAPKGLLLYGPPGCSKTLTAKALATESGLNFLAVKGPEIFNKYVGESEKAIREIFRKARAAAPSIIFFDEIDAIAASRDDDGGSNAGKQVLNSMLNEIDGVEELKGVIILGATNRPDIIDPALLRPGRLDRHVYVGPPDVEARLQILQKNTKHFKLQDGDSFLKKMAELTDGFSGSEVVLLCQEAGLTAIMENNECDSVSEEHFHKAIKDISKNITAEMLAYYEDFAEKYKAV